MFTAQVLLLIWLIIRFLVSIHRDIEGAPAREPSGFLGVLASLIAYALIVIVYFKAGLFSTF